MPETAQTHARKRSVVWAIASDALKARPATIGEWSDLVKARAAVLRVTLTPADLHDAINVLAARWARR